MGARALLILLSLTLGGCVAIPHLNQRSPYVSGRVIDIFSADPVPDARVEFVENPALAGITDEKGEFRIQASAKPELLVPIVHPPHALDMFATIPPILRITKEGYEPKELDGFDPQSLDLDNYLTAPRPTAQNEAPVFLRPIVLVRTAH